MKIVKLLVQVILSFVALYLVWVNIDYEQLLNIFLNADFIYLIIGFIFYNLSRLFGSIRLNLFFKEIALNISQKLNLKLFYLGMYYNLFLPGGIGGDGYKIYFLNKYFRAKKKEVFKSILLDRLTGLSALFFLLCLLLIDSQILFANQFHWLFYLLCAFIVFPATYFFSHKAFSFFDNIFLSSSLWAIVVQISQVVSALLILFSLGEFNNVTTYMSVFLVSSIVSVLPLSIGGIGARELTFVYLLPAASLDINIGVALSILFFIFTAVSSLIGIFYINLKPR